MRRNFFPAFAVISIAAIFVVSSGSVHHKTEKMAMPEPCPRNSCHCWCAAPEPADPIAPAAGQEENPVDIG